MSDLIIRRAAAGDFQRVMEISATVWEGNDYLPQVWDRWLTEPEEAGSLIVGEIGGRVVAIQHTSHQHGGVAWMEGIRVDPDLRNQGIGGKLLDHALGEARDGGLKRARLSTAHINEASSRVAMAKGFVEVAQYAIFTAAPSDERSEFVRAERITDRLLSATAVPSPRFVVKQWTAYEVGIQMSWEDCPYQLVYEVQDEPAGVAVAGDTRDGAEISVWCVVGDEAAAEQLGLALRHLAGEQSKKGVVAMLPDDPDLAAGLACAGYERNDHLEVLIFERDL